MTAEEKANANRKGKGKMSGRKRRHSFNTEVVGMKKQKGWDEEKEGAMITRTSVRIEEKGKLKEKEIVEAIEAFAHLNPCMMIDTKGFSESEENEGENEEAGSSQRKEEVKNEKVNVVSGWLNQINPPRGYVSPGMEYQRSSQTSGIRRVENPCERTQA